MSGNDTSLPFVAKNPLRLSSGRNSLLRVGDTHGRPSSLRLSRGSLGKNNLFSRSHQLNRLSMTQTRRLSDLNDLNPRSPFPLRQSCQTPILTTGFFFGAHLSLWIQALRTTIYWAMPPEALRPLQQAATLRRISKHTPI